MNDLDDLNEIIKDYLSPVKPSQSLINKTNNKYKQIISRKPIFSSLFQTGNLGFVFTLIVIALFIPIILKIYIPPVIDKNEATVASRITLPPQYIPMEKNQNSQLDNKNNAELFSANDPNVNAIANKIATPKPNKNSINEIAAIQTLAPVRAPSITVGDYQIDTPNPYQTQNPISTSQPLNEGDFEYTTINNGDSISITKYKGLGGNVTIPNTIDGKKVVDIGESSFAWCNNLSSVKISDRVISISKGAFHQCENLKSITIPSGVKSIGELAFAGCSQLSTITIPDSVTHIGNSAFIDCSIEYIKIPNSMTSIGSGVFAGCKELTNVIIPNSVVSIGQYAFSNCLSLTAVNIPNSVTSIGVLAFSNCSDLSSITIPSSVVTIGQSAFMNCDKLVIHGKKDSYAKQYATENDIPFIEQ